MRIASVNIGKVVTQPWRDGTQSAIHKKSVGDKPVMVHQTGIVGDEQADLKNHGGKDKAVLVLPSSAYMRFEIEHPYGYLGENITIDCSDDTQICLGDRLQIGMTLLEVSQPRSPCWKLDEQGNREHKLKRGKFLRNYAESGHVGFYCRVLATGRVHQCQEIIWLTREVHPKWPAIPIRDLFLAKYHPQTTHSKKLLLAAVKHPALSKAWKDELQHLLHPKTKTPKST